MLLNTKQLLTVLFLPLIFFQINAQSGKASKDYLKLGGAFRYTYMNKSWDKSNQKKGGEVAFDAVIFKAEGQVKGIDFFVESRYYSEDCGGFMLRNGYAGIPLNEQLYFKIGMPRTPFGIMPYTANNFMFNMPFYMGFEDDGDFGIVLEYTNKKWEAQLNFAKNAENAFDNKSNRFAYDISGDNEELNQITGRTAYHFGKTQQHEVGFSAQYGQIYNTITEDKGNSYALAVHAVFNKDRWNLKAQSILYEFSPEDETAVDYIEMGAFACDYKVAKKGIISSLGLSYHLPVNHKLLDDIQFYNDISALNKTTGNFKDSYMNVTGFLVHTGPIYMQVDYIVANNHPWIGANYDTDLFTGNSKKWNQRLNVNLGVYF